MLKSVPQCLDARQCFLESIDQQLATKQCLNHPHGCYIWLYRIIHISFTVTKRLDTCFMIDYICVMFSKLMRMVVKINKKPRIVTIDTTKI